MQRPCFLHGSIVRFAGWSTNGSPRMPGSATPNLSSRRHVRLAPIRSSPEKIKNSPPRVPGSASDPIGHLSCRFPNPQARAVRGQVGHLRLPTPPHLAAAQSKERALARLCDGDRLCRPTPCAQPSTADPRVEERSGRAFGADAPRFRPWAKLRGGPQLRLALAMLDTQHCRRSGSTGSGGKPDKCGGKCENLQGFAGSE
jgi:hypothetical protein